MADCKAFDRHLSVLVSLGLLSAGQKAFKLNKQISLGRLPAVTLSEAVCAFARMPRSDYP